jgi:hypothetical protein
VQSIATSTAQYNLGPASKAVLTLLKRRSNRARSQPGLPSMIQEPTSRSILLRDLRVRPSTGARALTRNKTPPQRTPVIRAIAECAPSRVQSFRCGDLRRHAAEESSPLRLANFCRRWRSHGRWPRRDARAGDVHPGGPNWRTSAWREADRLQRVVLRGSTIRENTAMSRSACGGDELRAPKWACTRPCSPKHSRSLCSALVHPRRHGFRQTLSSGHDALRLGARCIDAPGPRYLGFHSRASFCASAICAGVILAAT